jgi:histone H3/H4
VSAESEEAAEEIAEAVEEIAEVWAEEAVADVEVAEVERRRRTARVPGFQ